MMQANDIATTKISLFTTDRSLIGSHGLASLPIYFTEGRIW